MWRIGWNSKSHSWIQQTKCEIRHNWVGKVIHRELCNKLKLDRTIKSYVHKSEYFVDNEAHRYLRDFDIQMFHLISTRRQDLMLINKKKKMQ